MKTQTFRATVLPCLLMWCLGASAQVTKSGTITIQRPTGPTLVRPVQPATVTPAQPGVVKSTTTIVTPAKPGFVTPAKPGMVPPGTVISPGVIYTTPVTVIPSYPSGWVGPTIIRETHGPLPPSPSQQSTTQPLPASNGTPPLRLVAVLGNLLCHETTHGDAAKPGGDQVCVAVGALAGYLKLPANSGGARSWRAVGDFFGYCWDGLDWNATGGWSRGPMLTHPIFTANEVSPSPWPFEIGSAGRSLQSLRLAVDVFEYDAPEAVPGPGAEQPAGLFPRGRVAAMSDALNRIDWTSRASQLGAPGEGVSTTDRYYGSDRTFFGKALAIFGERTMTGATEASAEKDRIGMVEWFFSRDDLNTVMRECPTYAAVSPTTADLQAQRAAARTPAAWIKPFEVRGGNSRYTGEVWFLIVPDAALGAWLGVGGASGAQAGR